jgi:uncharacterized protein YbjT (DUF2867 family)
MKVAIFGATGMVGQGVLRECLLANDVEQVLLIGRTRLALEHPKLQQTIHPDLMQAEQGLAQVQGLDACFFCLGVSSAGMSEAQYRAQTYDLTLNIAKALAPHNPGMTFVYVSGAGTDSTEQGRTMWARVKGATENALQRLPFKGVYLFRPGIIQPLHGARSKTKSYRLFYILARPLLPIAKALFPKAVLTTEEVGRAMLNAVRRGYPSAVLETGDIAALARD